MKLHIFESTPTGFLDSTSNELHRVLPGPSLIRFEGEKKSPLVLATLLHGNEPTGIQAIQNLVRRYHQDNTPLPRTLYIFVGNIEAAKNNVRRLPNQIDYNRIWNGGELPEHRLANQVVDFLKGVKPFACVDIHNTSGKNPHYACINHVEAPLINLGHQFSNTLVYFTRPAEVLSIALAKICPSITIESGQPQDPHGVPHVMDFIETLPAETEQEEEKKEVAEPKAETPAKEAKPKAAAPKADAKAKPAAKKAAPKKAAAPKAEAKKETAKAKPEAKKAAPKKAADKKEDK